MGDDDFAKNQMMANLLMGNQQGQQQQGAFAPIGNALMMKAMQNRQAQNAYDKAPPPMANLSLPGAGGQPVQSQLSAKMPYMGPKGISGLFGLGGGV